MTTINIRDFIAGARFTRFHGGMLFWACFIITFDMYDLIVYGSVLPVLMKEWAMTPLQAGAIGSYGIFGMMVGAIMFGILADRLGRKRVLTASVVLFSLASALCGFAPGPLEFSLLRFLGGLGIGGILPCLIAMLTDYAPRGRANSMVAIVMCFFSVGGILAAFVSMLLLPALGWHAVYFVAILPLLFLPWMMKHFLDSPFVLLEQGRFGELRAALAKVDPEAALPADAEFTGLQEKEAGSPVGALFTNRRALGTIMIWIAFFMCLLMINGVSIWLPKLMVTAGYALNSSLTFMIVLNVGAIAGTLVLGKARRQVGREEGVDPDVRCLRALADAAGLRQQHGDPAGAGVHHRRVHHGRAEHLLLVRLAVLPVVHALDRDRVGLGRRAARCDRRPDLRRPVADHEPAGGDELPLLRHPGPLCGTGLHVRSAGPQGRGAGGPRRRRRAGRWRGIRENRTLNKTAP